MTRIAVCGDRGFTPDVEALIDEAVRAELARYPPDELVGISCIAGGADQIFARGVLDHGGRLEVVVPAARYRDALPQEGHAAYDDLFKRASAVRRLNHVESTPESHMDASIEMLKDADMLFAVWDGLPARSFGGTADVVDYAREHDIPVTVIWPVGAYR